MCADNLRSAFKNTFKFLSIKGIWQNCLGTFSSVCLLSKWKGLPFCFAPFSSACFWEGLTHIFSKPFHHVAKDHYKVSLHFLLSRLSKSNSFSVWLLAHHTFSALGYLHRSAAGLSSACAYLCPAENGTAHVLMPNWVNIRKNSNLLLEYTELKPQQNFCKFFYCKETHAIKINSRTIPEYIVMHLSVSTVLNRLLNWDLD